MISGEVAEHKRLLISAADSVSFSGRKINPNWSIDICARAVVINITAAVLSAAGINLKNKRANEILAVTIFIVIASKVVSSILNEPFTALFADCIDEVLSEYFEHAPGARAALFILAQTAYLEFHTTVAHDDIRHRFVDFVVRPESHSLAALATHMKLLCEVFGGTA